jgi:hypothetical protein
MPWRDSQQIIKIESEKLIVSGRNNLYQSGSVNGHKFAQEKSVRTRQKLK